MFLVSRWDYYVDGSDSGDIGLINFENGNFTKEKSRETFRKAINKMFRDYDKENIDLTLLLQPPHQRINPSTYYWSAVRGSIQNMGKRMEQVALEKSISIQEHLNRQKLANSTITEAQKPYSHIHLIDPAPVFCRKKCVFGDANSSYYLDDDHLSITGARKLKKHFHLFLDPSAHTADSVQKQHRI